MFWLVTAAMAMPVLQPPPPPGPHAALVAEPPLTAPLRFADEAPGSSGGPDLWAYGYLQAERADARRVPYRALSHVALFAAGVDPTGSLVDTERWKKASELVKHARPHGVRVHLAVACFERTTLSRLLRDSGSRATFVVELQRWLDRTGAHGVNLDFEDVPPSRRRDLLTLVRELEVAVDEVVVAVPAVDHSKAWDLQGLSRHAELYVMAYDYHWAGSSHAGPVDPLRAGAGTVWADVNAWSISRTIDDVLAAGADPARLVLGLPLYGREWPVGEDRVPARATGRGRAVSFDVAWQRAELHPTRLEPDAMSRVLYAEGRQLWFGEAQTVRKRMQMLREQTTWAGVGFWSVDYASDPVFWSAVAEERHVTDVRPSQPRKRREDRSTRWWVLALLTAILTASSTYWTRWYSDRRGELR